MNGYSKMKIIGNTKSRSMDFPSDLLSSSSLSFSETPDSKLEIPRTNKQQQQIKNNPVNSSRRKTQDSFSFLEQDEEEEDYHQEYNSNSNRNSSNNIGEKCGGHVKLSRNSSVSASASASASALHSAVKRAFSMRRSSSVSERYCRIHDQSVTLASPIDDEEDYAVEMGRTRSMKILKKKNNGRNKILKVCKKIFGL
ncbi:Phospho-N-acetylmuramoyl-pentapeptide-transferase [Melia azedarach]|uniref:Phospho-N-acetylmuramoyl-pentapeptide-transferase n=1 Tax=Melia azedarach TaxID=155640 RepID=A0ACC1Y4Q4_MELAZ|nr:Phospho-N-acetylmuramoyl-pentapeptide-transferase [Melia azedarach]